MNTARCWLDHAEFDQLRVWHACVHCEVHGWVDEDVAWSEARTAHKACEIARARHYDCDGKSAERQAEAGRQFAIEQIDAAGLQLAGYLKRRDAALFARNLLRSDKEAPVAELEAADQRVALEEMNVEHATRRLDDVLESNGEALPL